MSNETSHVMYMTRGAGHALITQTTGRVVAEDAETITIESIYGPPLLGGGKFFVIAKSDVFARKDGGRLSPEEIAAVIAEHRSEQRLP